MSNQDDNWKHRSAGMKCESCMYFVLKTGEGGLGRCRKNAPTNTGFVPVYTDDWCGQHRMDGTKAVQVKSITDTM